MNPRKLYIHEMSDFMNIQDLRDWSDKHNARNRAIEAFWHNLETYRVEDPEEFTELFWDYDQKYLKIWIEDISLHIKSLEYLDPSNKELEYIEVKVRIEYRANHIGYYRIIFGIDGQVEDDYFISDWTGLRLYQTRNLLEDMREEIENDLINGEIKEKEAMKLMKIIEEKKEKIRNSYAES
ncbi:hypothetical protein PAEAM_28160 [Paenibacillus sp. GM1FR]|uniref:hypothetical protein n=2 Tax=unclassified Paenibacillus TaxID=185978 RepID=UPI000CAE3CB1|nr:hypothetical protein [Paenibacillus sp. GM1FR]PJN60256.1 hypothetical protein PAEAM_28160 [Paenibacillus sp. GM1FR]